MENKKTVYHDRVNILFSEYYNSREESNMETKKQTLLMKIYEAMFCYLDCCGKPFNYSGNAKYTDYSLELLEVTKSSLKSFCEKKFEIDPETKSLKNANFAAYLKNFMDLRFNSLEAKNSLEDKTGISIPREKNLLIRKLKKEYEHLSRTIKNNVLLNEQIKIRFNLSDEDLKTYLPLIEGEKVSIDKPIGDDGEGSTFGDLLQSKTFQTPEEAYENSEALKLFLDKIQNAWILSKDTDGVLSDALTADVLGRLFGKITEGITENSIYPMFQEYSCFNSVMLKNFFEDPAFKLPTQEEIGQQHPNKEGKPMSKSGVSVKLTRFYEKLK